MNTFKSISDLRKELSQINQQIDSCIVRGKSYTHLSRAHKVVTGKIDRIYRDMTFTRTLRFLSLL